MGSHRLLKKVERAGSRSANKPSTSSPEPRAPKPGTKPTRPPVAKAVAWASDGCLVVLVARGGTPACIRLGPNRRLVGDALPAVAGALRVGVLPSGAVVTLARNGKGVLAHDGKTRRANVPFRVQELVVCEGIAYASGSDRSIARLDEATATWVDMRLAEATKPLLKKQEAEVDAAHSITAGANGPIVAVFANTYQKSLIMEWTGTSWHKRGEAAQTNAIARAPREDVVYAVGATVTAITKNGKARELPAFDGEKLWGCGWIDGPRRGLLASTLSTVHRVAANGACTEVLPRAPREHAPHNHSLFTSGADAAFVRGGNVYVLQGDTFVLTPLA